MKRKSSKKSSKNEEEPSNGVQEVDENGDSVDEEPQDKKRKSSGRGRKSKKDQENESGSEGDQNDDLVDEEPQDKKKKSSGKGRKSKKEQDYPENESDSEPHDDEIKRNKKKNKNKKEEKKDDADEEEEEDCQYEVEAVLDEKNIKGVRHYLIRWKGYTEESDTWEPESTLDCADLIQSYKKTKDKKKKEKKEVKKTDWDENDDFEVDRILEVHFRRDGKREFLVSWKGFPASENTWEPEENMDCQDLIERFMTKVERAKEVDTRELRTERKQVNRLNFNMHEGTGRRLSRRNKGKERVQYHDAE